MWRSFLKNGDNHSFSILYNSHIDKLYSYGIHLGFQKETCKDAIQDVFFKLYTSRESLTQIDNISAYLFKSFKNRLVDIVRKNTNTQIVELVNQPFSLDITILDNIIDAEEAILLKNKVEKLLKSLTAQQREAVYLRYMHELSYDEISELLNIKAESARKLISRTIRKLREQTGPHLSKAQLMLTFPLITIL